MSTMDFKGSIEAFEAADRTDDDLPFFGFRGIGIDGLPFCCEEHGNVDQAGAFRPTFDYDCITLLPRHTLVLLLACSALHAPDQLREMGVEIKEPGKVRVASLGMFSGWHRFEDAARDLNEEARLRKVLRARFGTGGVIRVERGKEHKYWFFLAARVSQVPMTPELLASVLARLVAAKIGAPCAEAERSFERALELLVKIVWRVHDALGPPPEPGEPDQAAKLVSGIVHWLEIADEAVRTRDGQVALLRLFYAIAFGRQRPRLDQLRKLRDALPQDARDILGTLNAEQIDEGRRAEACDLLREVLLHKFGLHRLPKHVEQRIAKGHLPLLRSSLLRAIDARSLADVFPRASQRQGKLQVTGRKSSRTKTVPAKAGKPSATKRAAVKGKASTAGRTGPTSRASSARTTR